MEEIRDQAKWLDSNGPLAKLLSSMLTYVGGEHGPSFKAGYDAAQKHSKIPSAPKPKPAEVNATPATPMGAPAPAARLLDDPYLLDPGEFNLDPDLAKAFKADAAAKLGDDRHPSPQQWAAILTPSSCAAVIGVAGTGKTFVMLMRAIWLHVYQEIPLSKILIVTVTKDCRFEIIAEIRHLFSLWDVDITDEMARDLVKTARGAALMVARSIQPMQDVVPFEVMGDLDDGDEDGRPFDLRLSAAQKSVLAGAYQRAYETSDVFAEAILELYAESMAVPRRLTPNARLNALVENWGQVRQADKELTEHAIKSWEKTRMIPADHLRLELIKLPCVGCEVFANGYVPALKSYLMLGVPGGVDPSYKRPGAKSPFVDEMRAKWSFVQRFTTERVIWINARAELDSLIGILSTLDTSAPQFNLIPKGEFRTISVYETLFRAGDLLQTLGLEVVPAIEEVTFIAGDTDKALYMAVAHFWPVLTEVLKEAEPSLMMFNDLFSGLRGAALRSVPDETLHRMQNLLADEVQDITMNSGEFIKACLREIRYRNRVDMTTTGCASIFACGDDFQTAHGTQGATPRYLVEFASQFPSKETKSYHLGTNYRSKQGILLSAHNLILGIPAIFRRVPESAKRLEGGEPVEIYPMSAQRFLALFDQHHGDGADILILIANQTVYRKMEDVVQVALDRDKAEGGQKRRVRVRAAQRSKGLEAEVVFILGDFTASTSTWAKNQFFRMAGTVAASGQSPFDEVQENELYRLAHIAMTRAKSRCYWLLPTAQEPGQGVSASNRLRGGSAGFIDHR